MSKTEPTKYTFKDEEEHDLFLDSGEEGSSSSSSEEEEERAIKSQSPSHPSSSATTATTTTRKGPARKARKQTVSKYFFQFGKTLLPPTPVRYSCGALCLMIEKGQIDLEPEYQRGVVWNTSKQSAVIDSLFRNCYVPPVLFSIHTAINEEGDCEELRICVDGKQRLSSIYKFMNNEIPIIEPGSGRSFWFRRGKNKIRFFTESQQDKFSQLQINCVEYRDLNEEYERDMFQRVQMGITLTPAEKLSANLGKWPDLFRELVKRFVENDELNLRHVLKMERGKDFMYIGMICLLIVHCEDNYFIPQSHVMAKFLRTDLPPTEAQKKTMIATIGKMTALANDDKYNAPLLPLRLPKRAAKSIAPIEFIFAGFICFRFSQANHAQLSQLIDGMMRRVRGEHSDLMLNTRVERTIRTYIREMETLHPFLLSLESSKSVGARRKRGRLADEEEWVPSAEPLNVRRPMRSVWQED